MTGDASSTDKNAYNADTANAGTTLGAYDSDIADYMSNVNSQLSAGNPYESQQYLEEQNLATSGAMHSENDAADQALQQTTARTGTNSAALANEEAESAREGQRDLTNYTAGRDTANEDKWIQDQQRLTSDQLAGAQSEAGVYGTQTGAGNAALGDYTTAEDAEDQMWAGLAGSALGGAGIGAGIAMK